MSSLFLKKCKPCEGGTSPLNGDQIKLYLYEIDSAWRHIRDNAIDKLEREFKFKDFIAATAFVNEVARIAEEEQHHPDIHIHYNKVRLVLWTHVISGLSENDFILAAKIDKL